MNCVRNCGIAKSSSTRTTNVDPGELAGEFWKENKPKNPEKNFPRNLWKNNLRRILWRDFWVLKYWKIRTPAPEACPFGTQIILGRNPRENPDEILERFPEDFWRNRQGKLKRNPWNPEASTGGIPGGMLHKIPDEFLKFPEEQRKKYSNNAHGIFRRYS